MKVIKNEKEYEEALVRAEELVDLDPDENTKEYEELELLTLLINTYEDQMYPIEMPDPIDAIKFRMEQQGLKNKDMITLFGSKSRVSEVLNRKRSLSLSMIRSLHEELHIPAEVLIADTTKTIPDNMEGLEWGKFPIYEMKKNGWIEFNGTALEAKERSEELIRPFLESARFDMRLNPIRFRKSLRSDKKIDEYALASWYAKVLIDQEDVVLDTSFDVSVMQESFFEDLRKLSFLEEGPQLAQEFLHRLGIKLVIVPHLRGTHLDGAVFYNTEPRPVIAMTLRYDRIDNFWFTLFHELSHAKLHFKDKEECIFDDLKSNHSLSESEKQADAFAEEHLIPGKKWFAFYSPYLSEDDIKTFAWKNRISPAIVAGRVQKERDDYKVFRKLLGQGKIRKLFGIETN